MTWRTFVTILLVAACSRVTWGQSYRNQDAAVGGIAGAVIGGIIGHQNDETPEGALIGGAVGAIAGSILGDAKDQQVAQRRYYQHQAYHQQQQAQRAMGRAVSITDAVAMSRSGLSESVIINQIRQNGVLDHIGTHEIISMHNNGVSERVITAMQSAPRAGNTAASVPASTVVVERTVAPRPVVVHQEYVVPAPRVRYVTRPAFPTYPSPHRFRRYW